MRQRPHFSEDGLIDALIDADKRNRLAARLFAAEIEGCDVYALIAEQRAKRTDIPGLIGILGIEHVRAKLGVHIDRLDLNDARLAIREHRAADGALAPLGL